MSKAIATKVKSTKITGKKTPLYKKVVKMKSESILHIVYAVKILAMIAFSVLMLLLPFSVFIKSFFISSQANLFCWLGSFAAVETLQFLEEKLKKSIMYPYDKK